MADTQIDELAVAVCLEMAEMEESVVDQLNNHPSHHVIVLSDVRRPLRHPAILAVVSHSDRTGCHDCFRVFLLRRRGDELQHLLGRCEDVRAIRLTNS